MSGSGPSSRAHHDGSSTRPFTTEQKLAVLRVRKCNNTAYYDILGLEAVRETCNDNDIKKAYRKLSLLTHPDKNGYDGADEAFKLVSRAFQILSDGEKRRRYDKFGGDPDSRFGGASADRSSGFSEFASRGASNGRRGPVFEEEISPEELFRQFFGGGGVGGAFTGPFGGSMFGGPGFAFNVGGGPGIRIHQFGGNGPRRRPHNHEDVQPTSPLAALQSLLPLILLFVVPLLSSLWSGIGTGGPSVRIDQAVPPYTHEHISHRLKIPYWVDPAEVEDLTARKWKELDKIAEGRFIAHLSSECEQEQNRYQRLLNDAQGFFFTDQVKLKQARDMDQPYCQRLRSYGYRIPEH